MTGCLSKMQSYQTATGVQPDEAILVYTATTYLDLTRVKFKNKDDGKLYESRDLAAGSRVLITKVPPGRYHLYGFQMNRTPMRANRDQEQQIYNVEAGKINYIGDLAIVPKLDQFGKPTATVNFRDNQNFIDGYLRENYPELMAERELQYVGIF